jgi:hypothetical protein
MHPDPKAWCRVNAEFLVELLSTFGDINTGIQCELVLSRFSSGLFRAMFAMKEIENGKEIHRRVSA